MPCVCVCVCMCACMRCADGRPLAPSRLLDLLVEVNNSPQIPPEQRIDVSLALDRRPASSSSSPSRPAGPGPKRLEQLLRDVPHSSYSAAREARPPYMADLAAPEGEARPANFLSADDVDNYMHAVDAALDIDSPLPSLAPRARPGAHPAATHPHLKNPTSVTNWLRKHAPKIFLQDGEHLFGGGGGAAAAPNDGEGGASATPAGGAGDRGGPKTAAKGAKRPAAASRPAPDRAGDWNASMDDGDLAAAGGARGKRKHDDDPGYRPGGSASRPSKKKRKSEGGEPTPSARRSKDKERDREGSVAAAAATAAAGGPVSDIVAKED